jgi:hypothetical protein
MPWAGRILGGPPNCAIAAWPAVAAKLGVGVGTVQQPFAVLPIGVAGSAGGQRAPARLTTHASCRSFDDVVRAIRALRTLRLMISSRRRGYRKGSARRGFARRADRGEGFVM